MGVDSKHEPRYNKICYLSLIIHLAAKRQYEMNDVIMTMVVYSYERLLAFSFIQLAEGKRHWQFSLWLNKLTMWTLFEDIKCHRSCYRDCYSRDDVNVCSGSLSPSPQKTVVWIQKCD